jgi:hypothetical protein
MKGHFAAPRLRRVVAVAAACGTALVVVALAVAAAPANDTFPGATITGSSGSVAGTTVEATMETGEPNNNGIPTATSDNSDLGGVSVWYAWVAPSTGTFHFCTVPGVDDFTPDTTLGVWTGAAVDGLTEVAFNDDTIRRDSWVSFAATSGETYHIGVGGFGGDTGPFTLKWGTTECAAPDTTITATKVRGKRVDLTFSASENASFPVTFACQVDGGSFVACTSPTTFTFAGRGTHTFAVRATDAAGNVEVYIESVTVQTKGPPV